MIDLLSLTDQELSAWRDGLEERLVATRVRGGMLERRAREAVGGFLTRHEPVTDPPAEAAVVRRVLVDGEPVGTVWSQRTGEARALLVELDVPAAHAAGTVSALLDLLGEQDVDELSLGLFAGDDAMAAVVESFQPTLVATNMQLDLSRPIPDDDRVRLVPMTEADYAAFIASAVEGFAGALLSSGAERSEEDALAESRRQHDQLLPDGLQTTGTRLWRVLAGSTDVGLLWIALDQDWAFIYDIEMAESARGQGYGTAALRAGARASREAGAAWLGLNVFGDNEGARRLYERSGYETVEQFFTLSTTPDEAA